MIQSVTVTNHLGESVVMDLRSPEKSGFYIRDIDGLGPANSVINSTEVLSSDGSFYNSSRITSRNIVFDIGFLDDGRSIEELRQQTYRFFPMKKPVIIEIKTDRRTGIATGYVESNRPNIFSKEESTSISLMCNSAFFQSKEIVQTIFSGTNPLFEFPFENPSTTQSLIQFGSVFINTIGNVLYTGDEETGVMIYIKVLGAVSNLIIYNTNTSQQMGIDSNKLIALTGENLKAGDQIVISTVRGSKYIYLIRNGIYINILNTLLSNASWFRISRGDNLFTYTAASGLSNLQFLIEHRLVYGGL